MAVEVYSYSDSFPDSEKFGLVSQMRRSATSIPSNIAEGSGRGTVRDFSKFLDYAIGSSFELETQILLCNRLKFLDEPITKGLMSEVNDIQRMTQSFKKSMF